MHSIPEQLCKDAQQALSTLLMNAGHKSALGLKDINSCELSFFFLNPRRAIALYYSISKERVPAAIAMNSHLRLRTRASCVARGRALACLDRDKGYNPLCQRGIKPGLPHAAGTLLPLCVPGMLSAELFQWIPSSVFHGWGGYWGAFFVRPSKA